MSKTAYCIYESRSGYLLVGTVTAGKRECIKAFSNNSGMDWLALRALGYRCMKVKITLDNKSGSF